MALSRVMPLPAATRPASGHPWRVAGAVLGVFLWMVFISLALRPSRFPVVFHRYSKEYAGLLLVVLAGAIIVTVAQLPRVFPLLYAQRHALLWLVVFCPLLIFGSVETAMRLFNLLGSDFYSEIRRYMSVLVLDDRLSFKNPALYRDTYKHVKIVTNELGLRERPLKPHAAGETRILVLGDSVAFGWGVNVEDAVPRQLERVLQASQNGTVETINSGVPGYNTNQELTFLEMYGPRLQPDVALLLYVDNDIDAIDPARVHLGVLPNPWKNPRGAGDYFLSRSRFYFLLSHILPVVAGSVAASPADRRRTPGWHQSMQSLHEMARICRDRGIPLAVFHFRMIDDPISRALNDDLEARARADGFSFSDTLPWFTGQNIRRLTNSFLDTHPNAEGHRILADGMAHVLLERGIVGAGFASPHSLSSRNAESLQ
jgi:lysophospholipase L1-like esterase